MSICRPYGEFGIDLSSKQRIHTLRQKLYHAQCIVLNTQDTMESFRVYANKVAILCKTSAVAQETFERDLENESNELRNHSRVIWKLLNTSNETKIMVSLNFKT